MDRGVRFRGRWDLLYELARLCPGGHSAQSKLITAPERLRQLRRLLLNVLLLQGRPGRLVQHMQRRDVGQEREQPDGEPEARHRQQQARRVPNTQNKTGATYPT